MNDNEKFIVTRKDMYSFVRSFAVAALETYMYNDLLKKDEKLDTKSFVDEFIDRLEIYR